ncbi:hypothetical protein Pan110_44920 [Gimesia panareensis]|nr:hypothetical protein Pan110_44920 [Gimesia panareensis]
MTDELEFHEEHREQEVRVTISPHSGTNIPFEIRTRQELESIDGDQTQVVSTNLSSPCSGGCINQDLTGVCYRCNLPVCDSCKTFCRACLKCVGKCHLKLIEGDDSQVIPLCDLCYRKYKKQRLLAFLLKLLLFPFLLLIDIFFEPPESEESSQ